MSKWTLERKAKFQATMKAKKAGGKKPKPGSSRGTNKTILIYLRQAKKAMLKELRTGQVKDLTESNLLTLLALKEAESTD